MKGYNLPDNVSYNDPSAPWNQEENYYDELLEAHRATLGLIDAMGDLAYSNHYDRICLVKKHGIMDILNTLRDLIKSEIDDIEDKK